MLRNKSKSRGRPRRPHSHADIQLLDYLAEISIKYEVGSSGLFANLIEAWNHRESTYKSLTIECREKTKGYATFLITYGNKSVAQLKVPEYVLKALKNPLEEFATAWEEKYKARIRVDHRIKDLRVGMKRINLKVRVLEIPEARCVFTQFGASNVTNALIADETGTIRLSLWNDQVNKISVNDVIEIENANVASFRGERQLRIGKNGRLHVVKAQNFSLEGIPVV